MKKVAFFSKEYEFIKKNNIFSHMLILLKYW